MKAWCAIKPFTSLSGFDPTEPRKSSGCGSSRRRGPKFWLRVMNEPKNRGVEDVLIAVVDGLKGFPEAITAVFPQTQVQTGIVHLIRQILDFVAYNDRKAVAAALKQMYRAKDAAGGEEELNTFAEGPWGQNTRRSPSPGDAIGSRSSRSTPSRRGASDHYTTNAIEFIERQISPSSSRPWPFPHRRERAEASLSRVEPGAKRMENAAARMGHGESAIRDHIRGQVQVGVTKPAFTRKS